MSEPSVPPTEPSATLGFHAELGALQAAHGGSAYQFARQAGLNGNRVAYWLATGAYPRPTQAAQLIAGLGIPEDQAARWRAEWQRSWARPARHVPRVTKHCAHCRTPFNALACEDRVYCSRRCNDAARCPIPPPRSLFHRAVYDRWLASGLPLTQFAARAGLTTTGLSRLLKAETPPNESTVAKLTQALGAPLPPIVTATALRRAVGIAKIAHARPAPGSPRFVEARRKAGRALAGRPLSAAHRQALAAAMRQSPAHARAHAQLVAAKRTPRGRAVSMLSRYLQDHPSPSRKQLRELAKHAAAKLGMSAAGVWGEWQTVLQKRGLVSKGGPTANETRHQLIDELMNGWPRTAAGRLRKGFWEEAARRVATAEGREWSGPELQEWYRRHTREPGRCEARADSA
jgi:hypothetical protein